MQSLIVTFKKYKFINSESSITEIQPVVHWQKVRLIVVYGFVQAQEVYKSTWIFPTAEMLCDELLTAICFLIIKEKESAHESLTRVPDDCCREVLIISCIAVLEMLLYCLVPSN